MSSHIACIAEPIEESPQLLDLLSMHDNNAEIITEAVTADDTSQLEPDDLVRWLEERLAEHGQVDADFLDLTKDAVAEDLVEASPIAEEAHGPDGAVEASETVADTFALPWLQFLGYLLISAEVIGESTTEFKAVGGQRLGVMHRMCAADTSLKATCTLHNKCVCWVRPRMAVTDDQVWKALAQWLAGGLTKYDHIVLAGFTFCKILGASGLRW